VGELSLFQRNALVGLWQRRVRAALGQYQVAEADCRKAMEEQSDAADPGGSFAYPKALQVERAALEKYTRTLRILTDLMVNGKLPPTEKIPTTDFPY
jgi:hypothetical protein